MLYDISFYLFKITTQKPEWPRTIAEPPRARLGKPLDLCQYKLIFDRHE
jgi:hypothetical protein